MTTYSIKSTATTILHPASLSHPVILDKLLHVVLRQVIGLDVGLDKLLVRDGSQVGQLLQLHQELLEVQLHQGPALIAAFFHIGIATVGDKTARGERSRLALQELGNLGVQDVSSVLYV